MDVEDYVLVYAQEHALTNAKDVLDAAMVVHRVLVDVAEIVSLAVLEDAKEDVVLAAQMDVVLAVHHLVVIIVLDVKNLVLEVVLIHVLEIVLMDVAIHVIHIARLVLDALEDVPVVMAALAVPVVVDAVAAAVVVVVLEQILMGLDVNTGMKEVIRYG